MTTRIGYACLDCYLVAHDPDHYSAWSDHDDTCLTDWVCTYGTPSDGCCTDPDGGICSACNGSGTEYGLTHNGFCDLGDHPVEGYWEYHTYTA